MSAQIQIQSYINSLAESKRLEMQSLHDSIAALLPDAQLWFIDGKDETGKIVCNPNIGYGRQQLHYADGKTKEFYQIGLSANTTGFSVYILGLSDKKYLINTYAKSLGKASVTSYCLKFKTVKDIDLEVLKSAILDGVAQTQITP